MAVMIYVYARISCVIANRHDNMTDISVHNKVSKEKSLYIHIYLEYSRISFIKISVISLNNNDVAVKEE